LHLNPEPAGTETKSGSLVRGGDIAKAQAENKEKKVYVSPKLTCHGTLRKIVRKAKKSGESTGSPGSKP
jgi:hypothetical protein